MSRSINRAMLLGNVGADPEIRATKDGKTVASFSLATADRRKDSTGNWKDEVEWHNVVVFGATADVVKEHVTKGKRLLIEGKIVTRSWKDEKSDSKKYKTEIVVDDLTLL